MISKTLNNIILNLLLILSLTSCWPILYIFDGEPNRFFLNSQPFTYFGEYSGYGDYAKECRNLDPPHPDYFFRYKNNVEPSRTCANYQEYLCNINITCQKHQDKEERRKCELDAKGYFLGSDWTYKSKRINSVNWHKTYCNRIKKQCDSAPKNDYTCRK